MQSIGRRNNNIWEKRNAYRALIHGDIRSDENGSQVGYALSGDYYWDYYDGYTLRIYAQLKYFVPEKIVLEIYIDEKGFCRPVNKNYKNITILNKFYGEIKSIKIKMIQKAGKQRRLRSVKPVQIQRRKRLFPAGNRRFFCHTGKKCACPFAGTGTVF